MRTGASGSRPGRLVEVAVDAAGAGGARPFTYSVPESLADLEDGEAVLVEFGRRQALGVVLGHADEAPSTTKPLVDRVRADGPLLPPLTLALARWIAGHYLAPPALVIRAMLPPGLLERLELVAERTPKAITGDLDVVDTDILDQLGGGARPARDLAAPDGRAGLLRRLRDLASRELVTLDWTLLGAGAGPRYERWIRLVPAGRAARGSAGGGAAAAGPSAGSAPGRRTRGAGEGFFRGGRIRGRGVGGRGGGAPWGRHPRLARPARVRRDRGAGTAAPAPRRAGPGFARWPAAVGRAHRAAGGGRGSRRPGDRRHGTRARSSWTA